MMNTLRFLLFVLIFGTTMPTLDAQTTCREVIGYYPNWQWYDRNKLVAPATIDYDQYSIINYCFFSPQPDGTIHNTDSWADENLLLGEIDWSTTPPGYIPNTSLIDLAHNAGVKVLVSIGGWTLSDNFPAIAADPVARATFASECNRLLSFYNFDGIDIDWEYPGYVPHGGSPQDKGNFTLLMQQIRDSIDALGLISGKSYLLTSCFGPSPAHAANIEWSNLISVVDMFNIMSYDYFGAFDCLANHNAPLFAPASGDPNFNLASTFHMLVNQYQVPPNKINMGVAFYGRSQTGASALFAPTSCNPDNLTFPEDLGSPLYYNILAKEYLFDKHRDTIAAVPYLLGKPGTTAAGTFVSFDDLQSIAEKAVFVATEQIRGVIIWEITGDYLETAAGTGIIAGTPLVDTINKIFCQYINTPPMPGAIAPHSLQIAVYPVPAKTSTNLQLRTATMGKAEILISNMNGKAVQREVILIQSPNMEIPISLAGLSEGMYMITVATASDISHTKLCISR
jgi:GH18 family chitinase